MADDSSGQSSYNAELRTVAKGGGLGLLGKTANQALALVAGPVTARLIGAGGYGLVQLCASLDDMLRIALSLGLPMSITKFVGIYESEGRRDLSRGAVAGSLTVCVTLAALVALIINLRPGLVTELLYGKPQLGPVLRIMILTVPIGLATGVMIPATIARRTMFYRMVIDLILRPVTLGGVIVLCWFLDYGARGAAIAYVIAGIIAVIIAAVGVKRLVGRLSPRDLRNFQFRKLMSVALPLLLTQLARFGLFRINNLIGGRWLTDEELGKYSAASRIATSGLVGKITMGTMFAPIIASLHHQGRRSELRRMFETTTRWGYHMALPVMAVAVIKAPAVMHLFGAEFVDAAPALRLLALGQIINTSVGPLPALIGMADLHWLSAMNNALAAGLNITLCILLTPTMRIVGLALAGVAAATVVNVMRVIEAALLLKITPYVWRASKPIVAGLLAAPVLYFVRFDAWMLDLFLPSLLFGATYLLLVRLLGLDPDDDNVLTALRRRLARTEAKGNSK